MYIILVLFYVVSVAKVLNICEQACMVKCNIGNLLSFVIMFMEYIYKLKGDFECCLLNVVAFLHA